jgi:hypothetical protein
MNALLKKLSDCLDLRVVEVELNKDRLTQMRAAKENSCRCKKCKDLIDEMHGRRNNQIQYMVEREGLSYWLDRQEHFDPVLHKLYVEPNNGYFREEYEDALSRQNDSSMSSTWLKTAS